MKPNETSHKIIEAAFELIADHGVDKTSLAMIAKVVGISKPAIYYHFPSKEALIDFLFESLFKDYHFSNYFTLQNYTKHNFEDLLIEDGFLMIEEYKADPDSLSVANEFIITMMRNHKYKERFVDMQKGFLDGFVDLITLGEKLGVVPVGKRVVKAHSLALLLDSISGYIVMDFHLEYKDMWEEAVKSIINPMKEGEMQ